MNNLLLTSDSYKYSQYNQYPPDTEGIYSYYESRGGEYPETVFFELQFLLKKYLVGQVVTQDKIDYAEELINAHFGQKIFNRAGWEYILNKHNGELPIRIMAVPEGSIIPTGNVLMTVENTDDKCYWLTSFLETLLSHLWYGCTVATQSWNMRQTIQKYLDETSDDTDPSYRLHCFGFRGVSSVESAGIGSLAHLTSFKGSDTVEALQVARSYYGEYMAANSINASEHSTVTSWGREYEKEAYENLIDKNPHGLVACVSDSYDIFHACRHIWGEQLRDKVWNRSGGPLVIRLDSGDPPLVVVKCLEILYGQFGGMLNKKGYKVLDSSVRTLQGDGINPEMMEKILHYMKWHGWAAENISFGSGGALLQKLNRDTCRFAYKCSAIKRSGKWYDVYKDPVTDQGKSSKKGRLGLYKEDNACDPKGYSYFTGPLGLDKEAHTHNWKNQLEEVFLNGKLTKETSLSEIRERVNSLFGAKV